MVTQSYPRWANRIARSGRKAVVLRRRRADIASARPDSILRIAAPPEHFTGAHASRTLRTKLLRLFKPIRALVVREGPRVRIHPPPAESLFLAGLYLRGSEPRLSARVSRLRSRRGRQRAAGPRKHRADPQQCLCRAIFQYRISRDAVATSCWVKVAGRVPKRDRACSGLRDAGGSCEFGLRSSKAERCPLIVPGKRQT